MNSNIKKLTFASLFAALTAVLTLFPHINVLGSAYIHLGDSVIYIAAILLGSVYGGLSAGVGSAIADLFVAPIYAPFTLVIKFLMGFTAGKIAKKDKLLSIRNILAMLVAGLIMVVGYIITDYIMLRAWDQAFIAAAFNLLQYAGSIILAIIFSIFLDTFKVANKI